jgi:hypothetical protein
MTLISDVDHTRIIFLNTCDFAFQGQYSLRPRCMDLLKKMKWTQAGYNLDQPEIVSCFYNTSSLTRM